MCSIRLLFMYFLISLSTRREGYKLPLPWCSHIVHLCTHVRFRYVHEILCPVLWEEKSFSQNLTYFYFLLWHSFTWKLAKKLRFFCYFHWHQKWAACRQFHFFFLTESDSFIFYVSFHAWNHQPVSFFDAKKSEKIKPFLASFTWNCATIKNKNKGGFCWNLLFYIKQAIKSRAFMANTAYRVRPSSYRLQQIVRIKLITILYTKICK